MMTPKQKRIITILAIANIVVVPAMVILVTHPSNTSPSPLPTPTLRAEDFETPGARQRSVGPTLSPAETDQGKASASKTPSQEICQWKAAQLLAQAGLCGIVTLSPDGSLRFEIVPGSSAPTAAVGPPLAPGETADEAKQLDDAAQLVWVAFDVVLATQEQEDKCNPFTQVEVTILAHSSQVTTRRPQRSGVSASVSAVDLLAFNAGELSEVEFIERVTYTITPLP